MKEFIEKLIERLEEQQAESENEMHRLRSGDYTLPCSYDITDIKEIASESFKESIEIVNELAEEYKGGWIPVSERLPDEGQTVLVQDFEDYYEVCTCETKQGVKGFSSGDWWASANNYIAWMPLPAPYKEGCE